MQKSRSHCRGQLVRRAAIGAGDVPAGDAYNQAPDAGGKGRAQYSRSSCNITRIAITIGPCGVIQSPSRPNSLQRDGLGWVPRCCGLTMASMRMTKDRRPGRRRKLSVEFAGKRATLAETAAWVELLRLCAMCCLVRLTRAEMACTPCSRAQH